MLTVSFTFPAKQFRDIFFFYFYVTRVTQTLVKFIHCKSHTSHTHEQFLKSVQGYDSNTFTFQHKTYIHTYNL